MRIKGIIRQHRRDFHATYQCEHCGFEHEGRGYDDGYFHSTVIPAMECPECGKASGVQSSTPTVPSGVVL